MRQVIFNPYRNWFGGPETPIGNGAFVQISRHAFFKLSQDEIAKNFLWFSTSKGYLFTHLSSQIPYVDADSIVSSINCYAYYNCSHSTGMTVIFWVDTGITDRQLANEMWHEINVYSLHYTTIIKRYCKWYKKETDHAKEILQTPEGIITYPDDEA